MIPVATNAFTTIRFPGAFSDLVGLDFTTNQSGLFQIVVREVTQTFSVRALHPASSGNLNASYRSQTHVLRFVTTNQPWHAVTFVEKGSEKISPVVELPAAPVESQRIVNIADLDLLDRVLACCKNTNCVEFSKIAGRGVGPALEVEIYGAFRVRNDEVVLLKIDIRNHLEATVSLPGIKATHNGQVLTPWYVSMPKQIDGQSSATILLGFRCGYMNTPFSIMSSNNFVVEIYTLSPPK